MTGCGVAGCDWATGPHHRHEVTVTAAGERRLPGHPVIVVHLAAGEPPRAACCGLLLPEPSEDTTTPRVLCEGCRRGAAGSAAAAADPAGDERRARELGDQVLERLMRFAPARPLNELARLALDLVELVAGQGWVPAERPTRPVTAEAPGAGGER